MADCWNHNVHYQRLILNAVPPGCGPALDVGCGDGALVRELAKRCQGATGIDLDETMIDLARRTAPDQPFINGDFMKYPFKPESCDFVAANTSLHHMDFAAALHKLAGIVRPGGRLAVVGLGKDAKPADWIIAAAAIPVNKLYQLRYDESQHPKMPVRQADLTWTQTRDTAKELLPGARYRRLLLWRYLLLWDKHG
ncbi:MAG: class I SAM-dependent methyltransferase [Streptosporangiaceae bacterium]